DDYGNDHGRDRIGGNEYSAPVDSVLDPRQLRKSYQRALRDWLQNTDDLDGLKNFSRQLQTTSEKPLRRLGRTAEAVFAGLAGGYLQPGPALQKHIASLDALLRSWSQANGSDQPLVEAESMTRALLGELDSADPGCPEIDRVRACIEDDEVELARARSVLSGRNRQLFTAIAEAARGELNQAKDALNAFLLGRSPVDGGTDEQSALLRSVAESFSMLGLQRLRERVDAQAERLGELSDDPENPVLMEVARELLLVESELDEAVLYLGEPPSGNLLEGDGQHLPKAEHRRVMRQVLIESIDDLGHAKHLLDQVNRGQADADGASLARHGLERVAGVLRMAGLDAAAELLEAGSRCVEDEMVQKISGQSNRERLDGLAEALVVVEFYLDSLTRLDDRGAAYLDSARRHLIELGYIEAVAEPAIEAADMTEAAQSEPSPIGQTAGHAPEDEALGGAATAIESGYLEPDADDHSSAPPPSADQGFGEDADEGWLSGPDDEEFDDRAGDSRQAPGSESRQRIPLPEFEEGLLSGPDANSTDDEEQDAEHAPIAGQPLESSADESLQATPEPSLPEPDESDLEDEIDALPPAQTSDEHEADWSPGHAPAGSDSRSDADFDRVQPSATETSALNSKADEKIEQEIAQEIEQEIEQESDEQSRAEAGYAIAAPTGSALEGDDFDLMSIFLEEFDEELESLQQRWPKWRDDLSNASLRGDIRRSFHTLKGSGRMAGADRIGEFGWQIEQLLNQTIDGQFQADQVVELVGKAVDALPSLRAHLTGEPAEMTESEIDELLERVDHVGGETILPELEGLDPTLVQLMIKEIGDHLQTVDEWINASRKQGWPAVVNRDLIRSIHTIKGTLRLAPIGNEADSMQIIEEYLQEILDTDSEPAEEIVDLIEDLRVMLGKRLERLERKAVALHHFETGDLTRQARGLLSALHQREQETGRAASSDQAPVGERPDAAGFDQGLEAAGFSLQQPPELDIQADQRLDETPDEVPIESRQAFVEGREETPGEELAPGSLPEPDDVQQDAEEMEPGLDFRADESAPSDEDLDAQDQSPMAPEAGAGQASGSEQPEPAEAGDALFDETGTEGLDEPADSIEAADESSEDAEAVEGFTPLQESVSTRRAPDDQEQVSGQELEPGVDIEAESEDESLEVGIDSESGSELESETEAETDAESESELEAEPGAETELDSGSGSEPRSDAETGPGLDDEIELESEPEHEA
ncbi:MAG: Hpt domain-containing protein, partial [Wenzhouxiangellaceae bacterium]|nr:Hpt domain-containing protein [Wenzhouxiangellaceae bacterium]